MVRVVHDTIHVETRICRLRVHCANEKSASCTWRNLHVFLVRGSVFVPGRSVKYQFNVKNTHSALLYASYVLTTSPAEITNYLVQ